ncbi:hypothetical protein P4S72_11135, partial [Vibrio sp. PP-XX7]
MEEALEQTHHHLMALLDHEHTSLASVQQCSGCDRANAIVWVFAELSLSGGSQQLTDVSHDSLSAVKPVVESSVIFAEENTNYPLSLAVNDIVDGG